MPINLEGHFLISLKGQNLNDHWNALTSLITTSEQYTNKLGHVHTTLTLTLGHWVLTS